jgi:heme exporter protein B
VLQLAIWVGATVLLDLPVSLDLIALVPLAVLTASSTATITALVLALVADAHHRPLLLPVILLPLLTPTLLAGVQGSTAILAGQSADALGWVVALVIETALFSGLGLLTYEAAASPN